MSHIAVIGFMGSGKTRMGKRLAKDLGMPFIDLDKAIATRMKMSTSDIFNRFGEPFYRALETYIVKGLIKEPEKIVISLGAAFPIQEQNEELMQSLGTVIYLKGSDKTILERIRGTPGNPLERGETSEEKILRMLHARDPVYERFATITVVTGEKSFDGLAAQVEDELRKIGEVVPEPSETSHEQ